MIKNIDEKDPEVYLRGFCLVKFNFNKNEKFNLTVYPSFIHKFFSCVLKIQGGDVKIFDA